MQWTKSKVATWLLISLIPTGALAILSFVIFALFVDDPESSGSFLLALAFVLSAIYGPLALVAGLVLKIVAGSGDRRLYRESRQYTEMHGWQQISETAWKSFKRNNVVLSVNKAYGQTTYILAVESDGDTAATDGFSRSLYALQFADFLWENVLSVKSQVDVAVVQQTRVEWERSLALPSRTPRPGQRETT